jgi:hypothetical protein
VNVRNYLKVFLMLCAEDPKQPRRKPSLRALNGCEKTLNAVWKRAARRAPPGSSPRDQSASRQLASPAGPPGNNPFNNPQLAPGGISGQTAGTVKQEFGTVQPYPAIPAIPAAGMMSKWGFLRKHKASDCQPPPRPRPSPTAPRCERRQHDQAHRLCRHAHGVDTSSDLDRASWQCLRAILLSACMGGAGPIRRWSRYKVTTSWCGMQTLG